MQVYTIYKATNKINQKSYIGFDSNWPNRMYRHLSGKGGVQRFARALKKYGKENFEWEVLYQSQDKKHTLTIMEPYFIKEHDSFGPNGYNLTVGGEGVLGWKASPEIREKLRQLRLGTTISDEVKAKMVIAHTGKFHTAESKSKIGSAHKGRFVSKETREKISISRKTLTEEAKRKLGNGWRGKKRPIETILKIQAAFAKRREIKNAQN